jgi:uncharacterized protein YdeI (BOF family)
MQFIYRGITERIWAQFKDDNYNLIDPSGSVAVNIMYQDGVTKISGGVGVHDSLGIYYYTITPDASWKYGYYGAWWSGWINGVYTTQDVPNIFKLKDPAESIIEGVLVDAVRSKLYMHLDAGGYRNKYLSDREMLDYIQNGLDWFNSEPPLITGFNFKNLPREYYRTVEIGAIVHALIGLEILEAGKHFSYNDNGISITRDRSGKYLSIYQSIMQTYLEEMKRIKQMYAMNHFGMRGLFSSTVGFPRSLSRALRGVSKFAH